MGADSLGKYVPAEKGGGGTIYLGDDPSIHTVVEELVHMQDHADQNFPPGIDYLGLAGSKVRDMEMATQVRLMNMPGWTNDEMNHFWTNYHLWRTGQLGGL